MLIAVANNSLGYLLAAGRVYLSRRVTTPDCELLLFELLHPKAPCSSLSRTDRAHSFHQFQAPGNGAGCVVSVALSLGLLPVAVNNCLCSVLPGLSSHLNK